jgi:hypothetical protein
MTEELEQFLSSFSSPHSEGSKTISYLASWDQLQLFSTIIDHRHCQLLILFRPQQSTIFITHCGNYENYDNRQFHQTPCIMYAFMQHPIYAHNRSCQNLLDFQVKSKQFLFLD